MSDIRFADISEFQASFDPDAYLRAGQRVIICRVHNGYRADHTMPGRMALVRSKPFVAVGYYLYLAKDRSPAEQAIETVGVIRELRANEFPIVDHEEGAGSQIARCEEALGVLDGWAGFPATLYSGAAYFDANLGGRARWRRPRWIASYPASYQPAPSQEPKLATFWQYTDRANFPGLAGGVDASIFHGTAEQFLRTVRGNAPTPAPAPGPDIADLAAKTVVQNRDGRLEEFVCSRGQIWHRWQQAPNGAWNKGWASLGSP